MRLIFSQPLHAIPFAQLRLHLAKAESALFAAVEERQAARQAGDTTMTRALGTAAESLTRLIDTLNGELTRRSGLN